MTAKELVDAIAIAIDERYNEQKNDEHALTRSQFWNAQVYVNISREFHENDIVPQHGRCTTIRLSTDITSDGDASVTMPEDDLLMICM